MSQSEVSSYPLSGVTLEGSGSMTVQQFLETPDLIQNTITIGGGPPTTTSTPPSQQCSQINTIISKWADIINLLIYLPKSYLITLFICIYY